MGNLSISSGGKPLETKGLQIRELKAGLSLEQAIEKTQGNGIDEAFVEADGKRYVIFSEDNLQLDPKVNLQLEGKAAKVLHLSNEINTFTEGLAFMPVKGYQIVKSAISPVVPNAATALAITGGVIAGAVSRNAVLPFMTNTTPLVLNDVAGALTGIVAGQTAAALLSSDSNSDMRMLAHVTGAAVGLGGGLTIGAGAAESLLRANFSKTTGFGIGLGALAGVASVAAHADQSSQSAPVRTLKALATGAGSVGLGAASPELVKALMQIRVPELLVKGAKVAGTAALVGGTMATLGLATAGALKHADTKSLDEISQ